MKNNFFSFLVFFCGFIYFFYLIQGWKQEFPVYTECRVMEQCYEIIRRITGHSQSEVNRSEKQVFSYVYFTEVAL